MIFVCTLLCYTSSEEDPNVIVINSHVATETYTTNHSQDHTTTSSSESVLSLVQHTDIATYANTSQPVHLTDRSPTLTQLPGPWKVLDTSSLSFPDFDGGSKCTDVICSNFAELSKSKCANTNLRGVKPSCHFQDGTSNIRVALLSYPGSGNTWIRQLIERSSGICTGELQNKLAPRCCMCSITSHLALYV